jgi:hypothetical protein
LQNNVVEAIKHVPPVTANHWRMALDLGFALLPIGLKSETGLSRVCIPQDSGHPPSCATEAATSGAREDADRRGLWTVRVRGKTWLGKQRGYKSRSEVAGSGLAKKRGRERAEDAPPTDILVAIEHQNLQGGPNICSCSLQKLFGS